MCLNEKAQPALSVSKSFVWENKEQIRGKG